MKRKILIVSLLLGLVGLSGMRLRTGPALYPFPYMDMFPPMPANKANPVTEEGVELGRYLFYDPILSADSTLSCASCHQQTAAFSDPGKARSLGVSGQPTRRNTPALFNLAWHPAYFWDGRAQNLEEQVFQPVRAHDEMNLRWAEAVHRIQNNNFYLPKFQAAFPNQPIDSLLIARAIAQFERTLLSYRSKYDRVLRQEEILSEQEYRGFVLMNDQTGGDCQHCHTTDADLLGTTFKYSNNGLDPAAHASEYPDPGRGAITGKQQEMGRFKIPSLRNIALSAPYMHDGRFETLREVLDFYSEGVEKSINVDAKMQRAHAGGVHLTEEEKDDILAFLHTLTDSAFIADPRFGNPFLGPPKRQK